MPKFGPVRHAGRLVLAAAVTALVSAVDDPRVHAQEPARPAPVAQPAPTGPPRPPQYVSPEVGADGRVTFRIHAPNAQAVRVSGSDIQGLTREAARMTKGADGIWTLTVSTPEPGSYRYNFDVDGVATIDLRNPATSESFNNTWSVVHVPGGKPWDTTDIPHGAVAQVTYHSTSLGIARRMHVYTPPGYEKSTTAYPVFYLLHGAGDSDESWTSVGRANFILDSLIAAKQATPMIVVMTAGHIRREGAQVIGAAATQDFVNDFMKDVKPLVESRYRVLKGRAHTAIAGLSMGGGQTLNIALPHLDQFAYVGVYSSGLLGGFPELSLRPPGAPPAPAVRMGPTADEWTKMHAAKLGDPALKKGLLLWFATGKDDFLLTTTQATVEMFKKLGFSPVYRETDGGHTWIKWRHYLVEFVPQLFKGTAASSARR